MRHKVAQRDLEDRTFDVDALSQFLDGLPAVRKWLSVMVRCVGKNMASPKAKCPPSTHAVPDEMCKPTASHLITASRQSHNEASIGSCTELVSTCSAAGFKTVPRPT